MKRQWYIEALLCIGLAVHSHYCGEALLRMAIIAEAHLHFGTIVQRYSCAEVVLHKNTVHPLVVLAPGTSCCIGTEWQQASHFLTSKLLQSCSPAMDEVPLTLPYRGGRLDVRVRPFLP